MNMMQMLGIVLFFYFISLIFICLYREQLNTRFWNGVFITADVLAFFCWNVAAYHRGWLDKRFMTLDNISPLICTVIPLTYFMKDSIRQAAYSAIACLSFGMFAAMLISPEHAYLFNYNIEANFLYTSEAICHMVCSLFGLYLMQSGQVKPDFTSWWKSIAFMFSIITFGVVLNVIFHKDFFGMDPYGNYRIYMLDIFGSFWTTLLAYYLGVFMVLTLGLQVGQLMCKTKQKTQSPLLASVENAEEKEEKPVAETLCDETAATISK